MRCTLCGKESDVLAEGKCMSCYEASLVPAAAPVASTAPTLVPRAPVAVVTKPTPAVKQRMSWGKLVLKGTILVIVGLGVGSGIAWYTLYYKTPDEVAVMTQSNFTADLPKLESTITQTDTSDDEPADTEETTTDTIETDTVTDTDTPTNEETAQAPVVDKNADTDADGIRDYIEARVGTDPEKPDTDGDGLSDSEEMRTYKTDATKADSDGDGIDDGAEIEEGTDPKVAPN